MALEIKELEIRMRVGGDDPDAAPVQRAGADTGGCGDGEQSHKQVVDDSVRRVLQALRNMEER